MAPRQLRRKIYILRSSSGGGGVGWDFVNWSTLQPDKTGIRRAVAWPDGPYVLPRGPWNIPDYVESPRFVMKRSLGRPPHDIEQIDGFFFITPVMKEVFEELAPGSCEYRRCITVQPNGEPGPEYWQCSVTRAFVNAADLERSKMQVADDGRYILIGNVDLKLRPDVIGDAHTFRLAEHYYVTFCDDLFKKRCREKNIKGTSFKQVGEVMT